jgi:hypothetical protein
MLGKFSVGLTLVVLEFVVLTPRAAINLAPEIFLSEPLLDPFRGSYKRFRNLQETHAGVCEKDVLVGEDQWEERLPVIHGM